MSSIGDISSSSSSSALLIYQEYLARLQAQKQSETKSQAIEVNAPGKAALASPAGVDHDGDSQ